MIYSFLFVRMPGEVVQSEREDNSYAGREAIGG